MNLFIRLCILLQFTNEHMITELECLSASLGGGTPDILLDINRSLTLRRNVANSPARNVVGRKMAKQKHKPHIKKDFFFL